MAQLPARTFSPPLQSSPSPSALSPSGSFPNKRPRLSPHPTSPRTLSPSPPHFNHPSLALPSAGTLTNGNTTMPPHAAGTMGPPSRPVERATDTAALTDVIAQSGIDIKDEEKWLTAFFSQKPESQGQSSQGLSFNSTHSSASDGSALSGGHGYGDPRQHSQHGQQYPVGGGSFSQGSGPPRSAEEIAQEEWKAAVRRRAETRSVHLNDPFLNGNALRQRTTKQVRRISATMNVVGVDKEQPSLPAQMHFNTPNVAGAGLGSHVTILEKDSPLTDVLTLMSLATGERIRGLMEDAVAAAKSRRVDSNGVVPLEWSDLAVSDKAGAAVSTALAGNRSGQDSAVSPLTTNPRKRSFSTANNLPTPVSNGAETPKTTLAIPNELARQLRGLASKERNVEEARLTKRARKSSTTGTSGDNSHRNSLVPGTPGSSSAGGGAGGGLFGERAPEVEPKKLSKKEQAKLQNARLDEAHQHRSANSTVSNFLGAGKSRFGKTYSWMTAAAAAGSPTVPSRLNTLGGGGGGGRAGGSLGSTAADNSPVSAGGALGLSGNAGRRLGEWREDRDKGAGIQLRDWIRVLEDEPKERNSLIRAYGKLK